jgi:LysM repeat protein
VSSPMHSVAVRAARTLTASVTVGGLVLAALALDGPATRHADSASVAVATPVADAAYVVTRSRDGRPWKGHPGRTLRRYTVRSGDTATRIAVRFHAWTAELLAINHRTASSYWYVGERVTVPVVTAAVRHARHHARPAHHKPAHHKPAHHRPRHHRPRHHSKPSRPPQYHPSRAQVRDEVRRVALRYGVRPNLALAIAWQESGWQQHVRSSAGAVGSMQVMPGTGRWLSTLLGRRLHLRRLHDNVVAGVLLFTLLRQDHGVRRSLAGYYQGIGSVQAHGTYASTRRYVRSVTLLWRMLNRGWHPLG